MEIKVTIKAWRERARQKWRQRRGKKLKPMQTNERKGSNGRKRESEGNGKE